MSRRRIPWLGGLVLACAVTPALAIDAREQRDRIEYETRQAEEMISSTGKLLDDQALDGYLQGLLTRLFPEEHQRLKIRVIKDAEFNAFAMGTGSIYFHTGALLRLQDEAQLATILAHEGGHVLRDHAFRSVTNMKSNAAFASVLSAGLLGTVGIDPGLGLIFAYSSIMGYSRDLEREADLTAMERLKATGYDRLAGAEVFALMQRELTVRKVKAGPYLFSSHPRLVDRVKSMTELAGPDTAGERNAQRYLEATAAARWTALEQVHSRGEGVALIHLLETEKLLSTLPPAACYYLAEGYRLRRAEGDEAKLPALYGDCTKAAPDFAPTFAALGRLRQRQGDTPGAIAAYDQYLALAPTGKEAGFVLASLKRLRGPATAADLAPPPSPPNPP